MLLIPKMTTVGDGAFLADDTLVGGYELGGGWLRVERVKVGKRAFLGNSGMTAPGRKVPKRGLVARAVGGARDEGEGGHVVARAARRCRCAAAAERRRHEPHLRPAAPAAGRPRRWSSCAGWCR